MYTVKTLQNHAKSRLRRIVYSIHACAFLPPIFMKAQWNIVLKYWRLPQSAFLDTVFDSRSLSFFRGVRFRSSPRIGPGRERSRRRGGQQVRRAENYLELASQAIDANVRMARAVERMAERHWGEGGIMKRQYSTVEGQRTIAISRSSVASSLSSFAARYTCHPGSFFWSQLSQSTWLKLHCILLGPAKARWADRSSAVRMIELRLLLPWLPAV